MNCILLKIEEKEGSSLTVRNTCTSEIPVLAIQNNLTLL